MFCPNCGTQVPEGSAFCPNCGTKVQIQNTQSDVNPAANAENMGAADASGAAENTAAQQVHTAQDAARQLTNAAMGVGATAQPADTAMGAGTETQPAKPKKKLDKKWIIAICVAVAAIAAGIITFVVLKNRKLTINLNDYAKFETEGYDGSGTVSFVFDSEKFEKDYKGKIKVDKKALKKEMGDEAAFLSALGQDEYDQLMLESIEDMADGEFDKESNLSNGDKVTFKWSLDEKELEEDVYKYINVRFKYSDIEYTVKGLDDVETRDPFKNVKVEFHGMDGDGYPEIAENPDHISFSFDKEEGLSNGDQVTLTIDVDDREEFIDTYGFAPTSPDSPSELAKIYTVEGLMGYVKKVSDLTEDNLSTILEDAQDDINAYAGGTYYNSELQHLTYLGAYLLTPKDGVNSSVKNYLCLVFTAEDIAGDGEYEPINVYYPVAYSNVYVDEDGEVDWGSYEGIQGYTENPNAGAMATGYYDPAVMFEEIVKGNEENYKCEMSPKLEQFGK